MLIKQIEFGSLDDAVIPIRYHVILFDRKFIGNNVIKSLTKGHIIDELQRTSPPYTVFSV